MSSRLLRARRGAWVALAVAVMMGAGGCHSAYIETTVRNASGGPISLLEVDYPSASFGKEALAMGAEYHYRFKVLGNGPTKVLWTDAGQHEHSVPGPSLNEGDEGRLVVTIRPADADFNLDKGRQ